MAGAIRVVVEMSVLVPAVDPLIKEARDRHRRRRRRFITAVLTLVFVATGIYTAIAARAHHPPAAGCGSCAIDPRTSGSGRYGVLFGFQRNYAAPSAIARVDPRTLTLIGPRLRIPRDFEPVGVSPDGKHLLLINGVPQRPRKGPSLSIVDLATMSHENRVDTALAAALGGWRPASAHWLTSRRILVVVQQYGTRRWREGPRRVTRQAMIAIDAQTGRIHWQRSLSTGLIATFNGFATHGTRAILVLESSDRAHPERARVMTITSNGRVRSSALRLEQGGYGGYPAQLVVTSAPQAEHAFVLTGGGVIYTIDPASGRSTRHQLPTPVNAPDTSPPALLLGAAALGDQIVVSSFFPRANGFAAAGIYLIDPRNWTTRIVDPTTPAWFVADSRLITFTVAGQFRLPSSWKSKGTGIRIYDHTGELRAHLYGTQAFDAVGVTPRFAFATLPARPPAAPPPETPATHRARLRALTMRELVFDPVRARRLGTRVQHGYPPAIIERARSRRAASRAVG
jgi:hypothetical protein